MPEAPSSAARMLRTLRDVTRSSLGATDRHVALTLLTYADNATLGSIRPSVPSVAQATGLGRRAVQQSIRRLEAAGVLVVERRGGAGPRSTSSYRFEPSALPMNRREEGRTTCAHKGAPDAPMSIEEGRTTCADGRTTSAHKGAPNDTKGRTTCARSPEELLRENSSENSSCSSGTAHAPPASVEAAAAADLPALPVAIEPPAGEPLPTNPEEQRRLVAQAWNACVVGQDAQRTALTAALNHTRNLWHVLRAIEAEKPGEIGEGDGAALRWLLDRIAVYGASRQCREAPCSLRTFLCGSERAGGGDATAGKWLEPPELWDAGPVPRVQRSAPWAKLARNSDEAAAVRRERAEELCRSGVSAAKGRGWDDLADAFGAASPAERVAAVARLDALLASLPPRWERDERTRAWCAAIRSRADEAGSDGRAMLGMELRGDETPAQAWRQLGERLRVPVPPKPETASATNLAAVS